MPPGPSPAAPSPLRVRVPFSGFAWPRLCACCLLAMDDLSAEQLADPLAAPQCEDCRHHRLMRKVERAMRWCRYFFGGLTVVFLLASLGVKGVRRIWLLGSAASFIPLALGLTGFLHLRLEDRKESCASFGDPVREVEKDASGILLECDNPHFARAVQEENPGAKIVERRPA